VSGFEPPARVALVTGAGRGIGAAVVRRLVADGCHVTAVDWCAGGDAPTAYAQASRADLEALAAAHPGRVEAVVADVRDRTALAAAADRTVERWGRIDVAVAAAAVIAGGRPLWETADAELDLLWDVDARGVWHTAAVTVPHMLAGPDPAGCRFVAVASAAGTHGLFRLAGYNAVKHAVVGMVKGLAADLVGTGVTAAAVSPGSTRTQMLEATAVLYDLPHSDAFGDSQLVRRVFEPEELAAAVCFCASREGGVVNGTVLHADGGFGG
jgi:SDR family mycofactocin-dependent oxidoreductase